MSIDKNSLTPLPLLPMNAMMEASWVDLLEGEFQKPYMRELESFLAGEYRSGKTVYPPFEQIFTAFCLTPFDRVKAVIIGQDPYHGPGQAHGLAFSVPRGVALPPSLVNIYKELRDDLGVEVPSHGCLEDWARQGVLLLNATLTVRAGEPKSHYGQGWERFTDQVVQLLSRREAPLVFMLWGKSAQEKWEHAQGGGGHHLVLSAPHPSPFSAHLGFFGCRHFSRANAFLSDPIDWRVK